MKRRFFKNENLQGDFFVCDITDIPLKDEMQTMSHPFFALSTKPSNKIFKYESDAGSLEVIPSGFGMPTIMDKDILIYCISHAVNEYNQTGTVPKEITFHSYDALTVTNRGTSGRSYQRLEYALTRLTGTVVKTSIKNGNEVINKGEGLINKWDVVTRATDNKVLASKIVLSDWIVEGIKAKNIKTIHKDYFLLRRPIDRRIYEIVKRHIGNKNEWAISIANLKERTGSNSPLKVFKQLIMESVKTNHLPEFKVKHVDGKLIFTKRNITALNARKHTNKNEDPILSDYAKIQASKVAPNYDVKYLYDQWVIKWKMDDKPDIMDTDKAFIAFCKKRNEISPNP